ncbi:uncharacterized protein CXQ87_005228 [Candidozyma duobushaemuli]|uniref:DH domain-containing protein n=2 Tax=Candidozyma TaxID=3303203 RepID=A0ABX8IBS4_9ASCO|nr:uncharacterized protein CXQ87_005228 [[Candida] duobushaemulonis]PVH14950.1 hypothetical protein CXQ87_005228 [[Candida] duobushaemulonis]QWU89978.1 hypothetical protein CA3LBN_004336 [[Candida] haemuloni]
MTLRHSSSFAAISSTRVRCTETSSKKPDKSESVRKSKTWPLRTQLAENFSPKAFTATSNQRSNHRSAAESINTSRSNDSIFERTNGSQTTARKTSTRATTPPSTIREPFESGWLSDTKSNYIMDELISTEEAFVSSLKILRYHVIEAFLQRCKLRGCRCFALEILAQTASCILEMHESLLHLRGQDFLERVTFNLRHYETYVRYYVNADAFSYLVLNETSNFTTEFTNSVLHNLENKSNSETAGKLDLSILSLVQKPMARIVKYQLLIASLSKTNPENETIRRSLTSVRMSLSKINCKLDRKVNSTERTRSLSEIVRFDQTIGQCPSYYGQLRFASVSSFAWPQFKRSLTMQKTVALLLFFETNLVICEYRSGMRRKTPLLVLPYDACSIVKNHLDFDGGLTNHSESCIKIRYHFQDCEYEAILGFPNSDARVEALSSIPNVPRSSSSYGVESFLPDSVAPSDIKIESSGVAQRKYQQCYFRKVIEYQARGPSERFFKSRNMRRLLRSD